VLEAAGRVLAVVDSVTAHGERPVRQTAHVRAVIAPDRFGTSLGAVEASLAIAAGWRETAPTDDLLLAPMSDGGPGFLDAVQFALGQRQRDGDSRRPHETPETDSSPCELHSVTVHGPCGGPVPAAVVMAGDVAYVEAAQACGLHLLGTAGRNPEISSTYGVGQLLLAAVDCGASRIVVGIGGAATNDAGAGLLAALGATATARSDPPDEHLLTAGGARLADVESVDLTAARQRLAGVRVVAATDVDVALAGPGGTSMVFAQEKGATREQAARLDAALQQWARVTDEGLARHAGAGAGGGLAHALLLLGAERTTGVEALAELSELPSAIRSADLVVTGELCFGHLSVRGTVPTLVAALATREGRPTIVLAGTVEIGRREMSGAGVESAYAVADDPRAAREAMSRPGDSLQRLARRVARSWSRR
jgi:glycerate 2-kinase